MRKIEDKDLVNKTIKSIDVSSVNVLTLNFTDDTSVELVAEPEVYTQYGIIPGIFIDKD